MTVEAVIKPDVYDSVRALSYLLQGRNGERLFFGAQTAKTDPFAPPGGNLTTVIGTEFTPAAVLDPMTMEVIQPAGRPAAIPNYVAGHWYYVAALFDLSNPGTMPPTNGARVTYYYADLTTGGPLIKSLDEHLFRFTSAIFNPVRMGVGLFVIGDPAANLVEGAPTGAQEFYRGSIENLTMYNPLLSEAEILQHLRALRVDGVPEPASLLLVSLGALAMLMFARRAR
jgi:hypothetical protein